MTNVEILSKRKKARFDFFVLAGVLYLAQHPLKFRKIAGNLYSHFKAVAS
jgi:hypothetical protein